MKKFIVLGLMLSLFTFGGSKGEVKTTYAATPGTSATLFSSSNAYYGRLLLSSIAEMQEYKDNIVKIEVSNVKPTNSIKTITLPDCTFTNASGASTNGVFAAYISNSTSTGKYDCVLYADVETIYANTSLTYMFSGFTNVETIDISKLNTSKTKKMDGMFSGCINLTSINFGNNFNTAQVTDMSYMFNNCYELTSLDLSMFNTSNTTSMRGMFNFDLFNDLEKTSQLKSIKFGNNFNTSKVIDMGSMFSGCKSLETLDVSKFNTENVTDMGFMFRGCSKLTTLDVSKFITSKVTSMISMFNGCSSLTKLDVSNFNTSNVTNMEGMFNNCSELTTIDVSHFNTEKVTGMRDMFGSCTSLKEVNLSSFNTSNVKDMTRMFNGCQSLTSLDLSSFDMTKSCERSDVTCDLLAFLNNCVSLENIKAPKALPADSATNSAHAIQLPEQFSDYCAVSELTTDNVVVNKELDITSGKFISDWRALRNNKDGLCAVFVPGSAANTKLNELLAQYDAFDTKTKDEVNKAIDKENVTIGESITYVKSVLDGTQKTNKDYSTKEDSGSFMTLSIKDESPYLIAVISLIGILSVLGYYFYNKKKQAM